MWHTFTDADRDTDTGDHADAYTHGDANSDAYADADSDAPGYADTNPNSDGDADKDSDANADTDSEPDAERIAIADMRFGFIPGVDRVRRLRRGPGAAPDGSAGRVWRDCR